MQAAVQFSRFTASAWTSDCTAGACCTADGPRAAATVRLRCDTTAAGTDAGTDAGEAPTDEAESEWQRMERDRSAPPLTPMDYGRMGTHLSAIARCGSAPT